MVGIVFLLTKTNIRKIFFSKAAESEVSDGSTFDINIHELDFREQISAALKKGDYRLAVRLQYLFILKKLSDKGLIQWRMDRTNYDYYLHLAGNRHQEEFRQVSLIYDYCWYGDFQVAETDYRRAEDMFNQFSSTVAGA
ncbi:MAG: hypothetical protein FD123_1974 [Bacteroidetes bacterium]|nr:MAG: hypothetical protein FD123_1974 [Bacteroidota bacterium]